MATRRRPSQRRSRRRSGFSFPRFDLPPINPEVARSIVGLFLVVLGAVTLIALILPGQGVLADWWIGSVGPWFGSLRWLLPFLLLGSGWYIEWGPGARPQSGWGITILGLSLSYVALLGAVQVTAIEWSGGRLGRFLAELLSRLVTAPGAFVLLVALSVIGVMLAFSLPLRDLIRPGTRLARWLGVTVSASIQRGPTRDIARQGRVVR